MCMNALIHRQMHVQSHMCISISPKTHPRPLYAYAFHFFKDKCTYSRMCGISIQPPAKPPKQIPFPPFWCPVMFHVATLMPHNDPSCLNKKRHIGNDFVTIVYNDSTRSYDMQAIRVCGIGRSISLWRMWHSIGRWVSLWRPYLK